MATRPRFSHNVTYVSGNERKSQEARLILKKNGVEADFVQLELPEIQGTLDEIAAAKAQFAAETLQCSVIVEDSALCITALGGMPGPYIKHFLNKMPLSDVARMLYAFPDKSAAAFCTVAFHPNPLVNRNPAGSTEPRLFVGRLDGEIVAPIGPQIFGWDAIFRPTHTKNPFGMTTAQIVEQWPERKHEFSERSQALKQCAEFIKTRSQRREAVYNKVD